MAFFSFGEQIDGKAYKVLDERVVRGTSGIMFLLGLIAFVNAFILKNYIVVPYISGFLALSFLISITINPNFSPITALARLLTYKQVPLYIGAVQKRFAYTLGFVMTSAIFVVSLFLLEDESLFNAVCMLCLICLLLLYLETAFGICVGCKLYKLAVKLNLMKAPEESPNCMGDSCDV